MRKSNIVLGLGLALSLAGAQVASAQQSGAETRRPRAEQGDRGPRGGRGGPDGFLLRGITLTDAQKTQLGALREQDRAQFQAQREQFQKERDELRALREKGDTAAVRARMTGRRTQMEQAQERRASAIRNILTAEQRVAFDKNVAEAKQRQAERGQRGEGFGKRGGKGRGQGGQRGAQGQQQGR